MLTYKGHIYYNENEYRLIDNHFIHSYIVAVQKKTESAIYLQKIYIY